MNQINGKNFEFLLSDLIKYANHRGKCKDR